MSLARAVPRPARCAVRERLLTRARRIPLDEYHLEVALSHYQELALSSGLPLAQYLVTMTRERGFLGDHECVTSRCTSGTPVLTQP